MNTVHTFTRFDTIVLSGLALTLFVANASHAADQYSLVEPATDTRTFQITHNLAVVGQLQTAKGDGTAAGLTLEVHASARYDERRLAGAGRDALSLRTARYYDAAEATIDVNRKVTRSALHPQHRLIIAQGRSTGVEPVSPDGPLTRQELDLLNTPGDSLAVLGLLPKTAIAAGSTWTPDSWAVQMLLDVDAVLKSEMTCRLESVTGSVARVTFTGTLDGATDGAATNLTVRGFLLYDMTRQYVSAAEVVQTEKRSVSAVSPGMEVTATARWQRTPLDSVGSLDQAKLEKIPTEIPEHWKWLWFSCPWKMGFTFERDWHVFHQNAQIAVLRLLDKGSLIAQCNVSRVVPAQPGAPVPLEKFRADIQKELGTRLKSLADTESIPVNGWTVNRIIATGESNKIAMAWRYYLCTAADGQQFAFVFAVETALLERFADRDTTIVQQLRTTP